MPLAKPPNSALMVKHLQRRLRVYALTAASAEDAQAFQQTITALDALQRVHAYEVGIVLATTRQPATTEGAQ